MARSQREQGEIEGASRSLRASIRQIGDSLGDDPDSRTHSNRKPREELTNRVADLEEAAYLRGVRAAYRNKGKSKIRTIAGKRRIKIRSNLS